MYGSIIGYLLSSFTEIDYMCEVVKNLFLEKETDKKFFVKYLQVSDKNQKNNRRCGFF